MLLVSWGEGLECIKEPTEAQNQLRSTVLHTGKNSSSNSGLPQEAEGESNHLSETASNCLLG
jgi:hypothetical protein